MKRVGIALILVVLVGSLAFGTEPIKIGGLFPLTGPLSPYGKEIVNGAKLAVQQINALGGVLGRPLELVVRDTATSPDVGRDAAAKLIEIDGVVAIVGALASGVTLAVSSVTIPAQIPLISPSSTSPAITELEDNDFVFRTCPSDALQGVVEAQLARNLGYKKVAVIFVNNAYGRGLAEVFKATFEDDEHVVTAMIPYEENKPSYRGEVEQALAGAPDAINLIAYPIDGNKIIIEALEQGYEGEFLFTDGMKGEGVTPGPACPTQGPCDEQYLEGSFGTAPGALVVAARAAFEADYEAAFGPSGIPFRAEAYDAVVLIALAIAAAGEASGPAIQAKLREVANPPGVEVTYGELAKAFALLGEGKDINYQGVSGPITWDKYGDPSEGAIEIWTVKDCQVQTVWVVEVK
ncbi:ABC transporter substrate-binding protein [Candidatus Bipolaricaulota sp. J31]